MRAKVLVLALLGLLILGIVLIRYHPGVSPPHVDPHAAQEIEKARQR
jgi:hypothetical protein